MQSSADRILPVVTPLNGFFWTAGRNNRLAIQRCDSCGHWLHPPGEICPVCLGRHLTPQPVSGFGTIEAITINYQVWKPGLEVPYAVVIVSLDECPNVRITSNLVGSDFEAGAIGSRVLVTFEQHEDVWLPLFRLVGDKP